MYYGPNLDAMFENSSAFVDKLLHGSPIAAMAIRHPDKFELLLNLKTAEAANIRIPESFVAKADFITGKTN